MNIDTKGIRNILFSKRGNCIGADIQDTAAFGDSMNDYEMMETAGISVAMGNAFDTLQNMADRILYKLLFFF